MYFISKNPQTLKNRPHQGKDYMMICSLSADPSRIQAQLDKLHALLKSTSPEISKRFLGLFDRYLSQTRLDLLFGDFVATVGAFTKNAISRRDLRPDDWQEIWPELANSVKA